MNSRTLIHGPLATSTLFALATACGGAQPADPQAPLAPETAPAESPQDETGGAESAERFEDMAPAARLKFMKAVVAPQMGKTFQAYNAEQYAEFGCVTCHGPGAKDGVFEMPNPALPKLPADPSAVFEEKPEIAKFMSEQVVPQMAKLLGEAAYNPETHQGFGCFDCHQKQ